ncbi:dihydropyrimidinase [Amycolatopsis pithecellobii]|uniref:Dihydropyrimidinase n=1 Tax=Amycolatopsis pithecellobii TaxID=664692 RepID=A0A6N7Z3F2_9PSEU|nr:dihydropyrimidinase [Amycolatopsis pithecellobii]MTD55639.1 dihydropyrimidinase [Amycolatopsis pithecellobii]
MSLDIAIRNGTLATADATFESDIGISDGKVVLISQNLPEAKREIDATGRIVVPGAIDVHTHFDRVHSWHGKKNTDDYETGTRAAAIGGITTVVNFAFQEPGWDLRQGIDHELALADGNAHIDFGLHTVVADLSVDGTLSAIKSVADEGYASVKIFTAVPHVGLTDPEILKVLEVCRDDGVLVSVHAEDDPLCNHLVNHYLEAGKTHVRYFPKARPPVAEALATGRVAAYARELGAPVYFVHLSSRKALQEVRRSREEGGEVYVETRPVYLYLDESRYELPDNQGNLYVCLPPLRSKMDQETLWQGMRNGEIQTYATDHAPWTSSQKLDAPNFSRIPAGVANVQTSIGMLYSDGVTRGKISLQQFVAVTSTNPAKLFGMWPRKGTLTPGADADIVLIDPRRAVELQNGGLASNVDYDPYAGYQGVGWPVMTISRGEIVAEEGRILSKPGRGRVVKRSRFQSL